jgi:hypothetical protein
MMYFIKAKLAFKQVKLAFAEAAAVELPEGKKCVNQASVQVGELTAEGAPGMIRWHCGGSSPADFAALNPPEGAKAAALVDWSIRPGCTDESVEALIAGANQIFTALAVPMLKSDNFTRDIKRTTNKAHLSGEPFHSFRIAKVDGAVRTVIFSGISTEDYTGGVDIKDWIPQYHQAIYFGWSLAGLLGATGTPAKISDLLQARMEFNFTWNTKLLHGLKTLANTSAARTLAMRMRPTPRIYFTSFGMMSGAASRVFGSQSAMWEMEFNGFQDIAEVNPGTDSLESAQICPSSLMASCGFLWQFPDGASSFVPSPASLACHWLLATPVCVLVCLLSRLLVLAVVCRFLHCPSIDSPSQSQSPT